jgi:transcriptional regulator with XRE-family HTH domain
MTTSAKRLVRSPDDEFDYALIGRRVRSARQAVGYSIEDLAETCGLTSAEILGIEEGLDVDATQIKRVAAALQVSVDDLVQGED